ncbi:MAG: glycosyltransferase [Paracoccus sp. (in: a-proteobacteria)]|nr:glycosyltransferase [Paracoccus sp. (in: a-proteobacteria)]
MSASSAASNAPIPLRPSVMRAAAGNAPPTLAERDPRHLGQILLEDGAVEQGHLLKAIVMRRRQDVPLGQILLSQGWVTEAALIHALTRQWRTSAVDPVALPPDSRLIDEIGAGFCLKHAALPWRRIGGITFMATSRPEGFETLRAALPPGYGPVRMLLTCESGLHAAVMSRRSTALTRQAEQSVPGPISCRTRNEARVTQLAALAAGLVALGLLMAPVLLMAVLTFWATLTLLTGLALKCAAFAAILRQRVEERADRTLIAVGLKTPREFRGPLPVISVMVPLFHESDVAGKLVARLSRLDYPRELTDILLVTEASDPITAAALRGVTLPHWVRVVSVPPGPVQTKPRALNYALNFCRGGIVGVWDAEDRPDPDQLHKVARSFAFAGDDVVCLQGQLDYFNPRSNWLARCFTIEYASWFRANLPGIARLGLVVPLGGTTLFFRRDRLEALGGWDAWNVTEDADLGVRLARRGWRTELIDTTTDEEANCRPLPWIKQRSRWLKGYAVTWGVHMRDPRALWRDLGARRFIAFQIQFLGSVSQYLLAPVLWSFWLLTLGGPHLLGPGLAGLWGGYVLSLLFAIFIASELIGMAINLWAVRGAKHRHLMKWVPLMHFYHPLGCLAGWKAIYEVVARPFYWDKTVHGVFDALEETEGQYTQPPVGTGEVTIPVLGQIGAEPRAPAAASPAASLPEYSIPPPQCAQAARA